MMRQVPIFLKRWRRCHSHQSISQFLHKSSNRWSCVLRSSGNAWNYNNNGMSNNNGISDNQLAVRPVTKF